MSTWPYLKVCATLQHWAQTVTVSYPNISNLKINATKGAVSFASQPSEMTSNYLPVCSANISGMLKYTWAVSWTVQPSKTCRLRHLFDIGSKAPMQYRLSYCFTSLARFWRPAHQESYHVIHPWIKSRSYQKNLHSFMPAGNFLICKLATSSFYKKSCLDPFCSFGLNLDRMRCLKPTLQKLKVRAHLKAWLRLGKRIWYPLAWTISGWVKSPWLLVLRMSRTKFAVQLVVHLGVDLIFSANSAVLPSWH